MPPLLRSILIYAGFVFTAALAILKLRAIVFVEFRAKQLVYAVVFGYIAVVLWRTRRPPPSDDVR
jgi:hypothetical protein